MTVVIDDFNNGQCGVPGMNHHIPGVAVNTVGPTVVAFSNEVRVWQKRLTGAVQQDETNDKLLFELDGSRPLSRIQLFRRLRSLV